MSEIEIAYLCDQKACKVGADCSICHHTLDIRHAKNFWKIDEEKYVERETEMADLTYKSIKECDYVKRFGACYGHKVCLAKELKMPDKEEKEDLVNHPSHYTNRDVETIDSMVIIFGAKETATICLGNCFKYLDRYKFKGNPQQDLEKALWYAKKAFSLLYLEKDPEETCCYMRDFEFDVYSESLNYREFYVAEAKRDLIIIRHSQSEECLANFIRHIELAVNSQ